jgi:hypothetical protein
MDVYLPNTPSELIRLAIKDLELCEQDSKYVINMVVWYMDEGEHCSVCLAGAVMAQELGSELLDTCLAACWDGDLEVGPFEVSKVFGADCASKLRALNCFGRGFIGEGLDYLGKGGACPVERYMDVESYSVDSVRFKRDIVLVAERLESVGL